MTLLNFVTASFPEMYERLLVPIAEESAELLADHSDRGALSYKITSNVATARRTAAS